MTAYERRKAIMQILRLRKFEKVDNLAFQFSVTPRTIKRDIEMLSLTESIYTQQGKYGGGIYYVGPTPAKPGRAIGSAGPTSSYRMDPYAEPLLKQGLKVMIGKGPRSQEYKDLLVKYNAVYLSAIGGAAASISESIKKCDLVCYEDLGAEAIYRLEVEDFFSIVTYDTLGNDLFEQGINKYKG